MEVEFLRDLVIIISGLIITCVVIFLAVLAYLLYNRAKSFMDSVGSVATTVREITAVVKDEVVSPVVQFTALIRGICQGVETVSRLFKKQEGGRDG